MALVSDFGRHGPRSGTRRTVRRRVGHSSSSRTESSVSRTAPSSSSTSDAFRTTRSISAAGRRPTSRTRSTPRGHGAPAIGIAAAYGLALAAERGEDLDTALETLAASRPTAVNLRWALEAMRDDPTRERAERIHEDEVDRCRRMGAHAVELFPESARVLTHCNAGGLATGGYGTALGAVRAAFEAGRVNHVWVDETRPLLQGGRLTAWELEQLGIPHAVIADSAAASFMARGGWT
jgi:methylthioribose-1-phosphate isomerase